MKQLNLGHAIAIMWMIIGFFTLSFDLKRGVKSSAYLMPRPNIIFFIYYKVSCINFSILYVHIFECHLISVNQLTAPNF